ncbi:MAG: hypothetical protein IKP40_05370 [Clostridia bacterium]|nr:hypothetical protein [Clostridia bacterium]
MTVRRAMKEAWALYRAHPGDMLLFMLLQVAVRLIALCPLLCLADASLRWGVLLCLPLWVLLVLPARQRAAAVMQTAIRGGRLFAKRLLIGPDWGRDVVRGLKMIPFLLLWLLPFIGVTAFAYYMYTGDTDIFTAMRWIMDLGGGDFTSGLLPALLIYLCFTLPFFFGLAFHSGRRHELALSDRRFLKGHRGGVILSWLAGLLAFVPFVAATAVTVVSYVMQLLPILGESISSLGRSAQSIPRPGSRVILVGVAFVVLLLPLIPLKSLITACYVHGCWEGRE